MAQKKWKQRTYTGELNKPIKFSDHDDWEVWEAWYRDNPVKLLEGKANIGAARGEKMAAKLALLLAEYKIPEDDPEKWFRLVCELAYAHVRGFSASNIGAPKKWPLAKSAEFVRAVIESRVEISIERDCKTAQVRKIDAIRRLIRKTSKWGKKEHSLVNLFNSSVKNPALWMLLNAPNQAPNKQANLSRYTK